MREPVSRLFGQGLSDRWLSREGLSGQGLSGQGLSSEGTREQWLLAQNAILRVAARRNDLFRRDAFEELARTLGAFVPLGRLVVVVPDGDEQALFAASVGDDASPLPPFGARFPLPDEQNRRTVMEGAPRICNDTRLGDAVDRAVALSGYLSYAALPIRDLANEAESQPIVAKLVVCFREADQAAEAPLDLLEDAAALFGAHYRRALSLSRERRLAMLLETSEDAMLAWDRSGKIADANAAASLLTGLPSSTLIGRHIVELVPGIGDPMAPEPKRAHRTRLLTRQADGSHAWVPVSVTVTSVVDDAQVSAHMLLRDASHVLAAEREAAEQLARVRRLEQEHRTLLDNAPLVVFRLDPETGAVRYLNRRAELLLGISPDDALARPGCLRAAHADVQAAERFDEAYARAQQGLPAAPYEARLVNPEGSELTVRASIYPLCEAARVIAIEGIFADISAEHAARTQLVRTDRLSTLGRLAAGVAHEINNPAAFLMLGLEHLQRVLGAARSGMAEEDRIDAQKLVGQLTESLQRIAAIVRDLRLFAGPVQPRAGASAVLTDVHRGVQSALTLTRSQLAERARLMVDLAPVPPALMEQGRLAQVVVNLLVNAAQAIPKDRAREHRITVATRQRGDEVQIEVSDTGVGIPAGDLARIWTPFFTTKDIGTGLGLSITRDIVERAGGTIEVISPAFEEPGVGAVGSRFIVCLKPAPGAWKAPPPAEPTGTLQATEGVARGHPVSSVKKRILLVEDELPLGRALAYALAPHHHVELVHGGAEALQLLASRQFDAVVCDVRMPEMCGESLYARACALSPALQKSFIFMTGIGLGADLARLQHVHQRPILEKPFSVDQLLKAISALR